MSLSLIIDESTIEQVKEHRVLGVIIDENFNWQSHINRVCKSLARNLFLLGKLKHYTDTATRKLFFEAHCLSRINYASTVWSGASNNHIKQINSMHRRGAKLILPDNSLSTTEKLAKLNILPLHSLLTYNKMVLMFKVHSQIAPPYLAEFVQAATKRYNSNNYILPHVRIDLFKSSFAFYGPTVWNSLPTSVKESQSLKSFKSGILKLLLQQEVPSMSL